MSTLGWRKTHCKRGHPLTDNNLVPWAKRRECLTCRRERQRRYDREVRGYKPQIEKFGGTRTHFPCGHSRGQAYYSKRGYPACAVCAKARAKTLRDAKRKPGDAWRERGTETHYGCGHPRRARPHGRKSPSCPICRPRRSYRADAFPNDPDSTLFAEVVRADPCSYCGAIGGEVDHIIPTSRGGRNHWENLTAACRSCNARKSSAFFFLARLLAEQGDCVAIP